MATKKPKTAVLSVRLPHTLKESLKAAAAKDKRPLNQYCHIVLEQALKLSLVAALLLLSAGAASADTLFTYQGNVMQPCQCALSGSVTLDNAGQAVAWDFTDGQYSLNSSDSFMEEFSFTEPYGPAYPLWKLLIVDHIDNTTLAFFSQYYGSEFESSDASNDGSEQGNHGFWTDPPAATPEPSSAQLMALGLALLIGAIATQDGRKRA